MNVANFLRAAVDTLHEDVVNGAVAGLASEIAFGLPVWANFVVAGVVLIGSSLVKNGTVLKVKAVADVATEVAQTVDSALQSAPTKLP